MYVLKWSIDGWLYKMCMNIYTFAADIYTLILQVAGAKIMDNATVSTYVGNIGILVGVFMLFKVAISLLTYLVDPDQTDDKRTGSTSLISGIVVTMALLIAYPFAFKALRVVQDAILNPKDGNNILVQLFAGSSRKEPGKHVNGINCYYVNGAHPDIRYDSFDLQISIASNGTNEEIYYVDVTSDPYKNTFGYYDVDLTDKKTIEGISYDRKISTLFMYDDYKESAWVQKFKGTFSEVLYIRNNSNAITVDELGAESKINNCPKYARYNFTRSYHGLSKYRVYLFDDPTYADEKFSGRAAVLDLSKTTERSYVNDAGRVMAGSLLFSFVTCNSSIDDGEERCQNLAEVESRNDIEKAYDYIMNKDKDGIAEAVEFQSFLALLFGIVLILFLVTTTADVAVRTVKLMVLEIFAPIPIVSYCDPKSRNVFESWLKTLGIVYADIFIRIIIIAVCNFLISSISVSGYSGFVQIALIIGILLFLKEAPQFICNMFGIKSQGLGNFTLNPMQKLKEVPLIGSAVSAGGMFASSVLAGHKLSDAAANAGTAWRKNGGLMSTGKEVPQGFLSRTSDMRKARIKSDVEKNRQASRDEALFRITDEVSDSTHYTASRGKDKGKTTFTSLSDEDLTLHAHVRNIDNNTTPPLTPTNTGGNLGPQNAGAQNPGRQYQNWDDVGE